MNAQIAIDDDLLKDFYLFKQGKPCDTKRVMQLLSYYKPHLTCVDQLKRIGVNDASLLAQLASSDWIHQSIEELAQCTNLKLILTANASDYPYVNVAGGDAIEPNYTGTFKNVPRSKAILHLKALCQNASSIYIYDPFLKKYQERSTQTIMDGIFSLLPRNAITLYCDESSFSQATKSEWKRKNNQLNFRNVDTNSSYKGLHDRYLVIDRKVEIILSSGFDYLFDVQGDFTYVVRLFT